jgi:hypothetical protein
MALPPRPIDARNRIVFTLSPPASMQAGEALVSSRRASDSATRPAVCVRGPREGGAS